MDEEDRLKMGMEAEARATEQDVQEFLTSNVWHDLKHIMDARLEVIRHEIVTADTLEKVKLLQGEYKGIDFWRCLPELVMERIKVERKLKEEANNE